MCTKGERAEMITYVKEEKRERKKESEIERVKDKRKKKNKKKINARRRMSVNGMIFVWSGKVCSAALRTREWCIVH